MKLLQLTFALVTTTTLGLVGACSSNDDKAPNTDTDANADLEDASATSDATSDAPPGDSGPVSCTGVAQALLKPQTTVADGQVTVVSDVDGVKILYIDATTGGQQAAPSKPRVYVNLETSTRVDISDVAAATDTSWDLAFKRAVFFTDSGHAGAGQGGAVFLAGKDFDAVTLADADGKTFAEEEFYDEQCTPKVDQIGAIITSFGTWYDYSNAVLTPKAGTYLVKGGTGKLYKFAVLSYYAAIDGGVSGNAALYSVKVKAL